MIWSETKKQRHKIIKIKDFPAEHKVKVIRVVLSIQHTNYVVTNEIEKNNAEFSKMSAISARKSSDFTAKPNS